VPKNVLDFWGTKAYGSEFALGWRSSGVEQLICNQPVGGSNPFASSGLVASHLRAIDLHAPPGAFCELIRRLGEVPERPKGADCKSAGVGLRRFESSPPHCGGGGTFRENVVARNRQRFQPSAASL
jgi:hypothetical protein